MSDIKEVKSGVLAGAQNIKEDIKEAVSEVGEKLEELNNGKLDPEELTLAELMGAEPRKEKTYDLNAEEGVKAENSLLTGMEISEEKAEEIEEVADTIQELKEYEEAVNSGDAVREDSELNNLGETLAVVMGAETAAKPVDQK